MIIAIDFDGTVVKDKFPFIGDDIGAVPVLRKLVDNGHYLILYTMRSHKIFSKVNPWISVLDEAIQWFKDNNIPLYEVNRDLGQDEWTTSPKCNADLYIDDKSLGIPLRYELYGKPYVDWDKVYKLLCEKGIITK